MSIADTTGKRVTIIPADPKYMQKDIRKQRLRVAPYCRVSTDSDEQLTSYESQIAYYTSKIEENPDWTMVRLYADEGITGTSMKKRKQFLKMIADCEEGKIDLVITKSTNSLRSKHTGGHPDRTQAQAAGYRRVLREREREHALHGQRDDPHVLLLTGASGE